MTKETLRNLLLFYGIVKQNKWLDKYLDLVISNLNSEQRKHLTEAHHVIPLSTYAIKLKIKHSRKDSIAFDHNNFAVNLTYAEHCLAHCYLALCSTSRALRKKNWNVHAGKLHLGKNCRLFKRIRLRRFTADHSNIDRLNEQHVEIMKRRYQKISAKKQLSKEAYN